MQHPLRNALLNGNLDLAKHIVRKYGIEVKGTAMVCNPWAILQWIQLGLTAVFYGFSYRKMHYC